MSQRKSNALPGFVRRPLIRETGFYLFVVVVGAYAMHIHYTTRNRGAFSVFPICFFLFHGHPIQPCRRLSSRLLIFCSLPELHIPVVKQRRTFAGPSILYYPSLPRFGSSSSAYTLLRRTANHYFRTIIYNIIRRWI